jgi:hypothetical protein
MTYTYRLLHLLSFREMEHDEEEEEEEELEE